MLHWHHHDQAVETVRKLPRERQDHIGDVLLTMATPLSEENYTPEQIAAIEEGLANAATGRFASPDDMEAFFSPEVPETNCGVCGAK